jgi:uncharacterized protein
VLVKMKIWLVVASVVAAIGSVPGMCGAVSFDCSKAQTYREKSVCSSTILSGLDDELNSAYRTATQTWGNKQALVDSQRKWISDTNRCFDEGCIAVAYHSRIAELNGADAEDDDNDNVEDTAPPPAATQQKEGQTNSGGIDGILNRTNRVGQEADERASAVAPYFSTAEEFGSFYAGIKQGERLDGQRLAAGLEQTIVANGGQFAGYLCSGQLAAYSPQMLLDFIRYKKSEVSSQPPTFFTTASEDAANGFSNSLGNLKRYIDDTWDDPVCKRNGQLLDTVLKDLGRAADSANEVARASLKASYAAQLERDKQLQAEQAAAAQRRDEEQRAEQARKDEEQWQVAARNAEETRLAASHRQVAAQGQAKEPTQEQGASQAVPESRVAGAVTGASGEVPLSSDTEKPKAGFVGRIFGGIAGFFGRVLATLIWLMPAVLPMQRARIQLQGYVIDPEKDEFSFPGGWISANSVSDYFKINFITQAFRRFTIRLSDIQQLSQSYSDCVEIQGSFGAAEFRLRDEGKRDQLFAAIRQANRMGTPVFRAD